MVVLIPARDEAATIDTCLDSIEVSARDWGGPVVVHVGADSCRDDTADRARRHPSVTSVVEGAWAGAGATRRHLTAAALGSFGDALDGVWVASTDADSTVAADWLRRQVDAADGGLDVALGTVELDAATPHDLVARFAETYRVGEGHPHVHGANLGIRATAYRQVGGWDERVLVGEDHDLVDRARACGLEVGALGDLVVTTSGRTRGRVVGGFATTLAELLPRTPPRPLTPV